MNFHYSLFKIESFQIVDYSKLDKIFNIYCAFFNGIFLKLPLSMLHNYNVLKTTLCNFDSSTMKTISLKNFFFFCCAYPLRIMQPFLFLHEILSFATLGRSPCQFHFFQSLPQRIFTGST